MGQKALTLRCLEDRDMAVQFEESESKEGTPCIFVSDSESDEGVLLTDAQVNEVIEFLEDWRVRQTGKS